MSRVQSRRFERAKQRRWLVTTRALISLAQSSLNLDDRQMHEAHNQPGELNDIVLARTVELLVLVNGNASDHNRATLAELEQRNGPGFLARVAAMGEPARKALQRAGVLVAFVVALLFSSTAHASPSSPAPIGSEVDIMYRLRDRRRRRWSCRILPRLPLGLTQEGCYGRGGTTVAAVSGGVLRRARVRQLGTHARSRARAGRGDLRSRARVGATSISNRQRPEGRALFRDRAFRRLDRAVVERQRVVALALVTTPKASRETRGFASIEAPDA